MKTSFLLISFVLGTSTLAAEIPLREGEQLEIRVVGCPMGTLPYIDVVGPDKNDRAHKVLSVQCAATQCRFMYSEIRREIGTSNPTSAYGMIYFDYLLKDGTRATEELFAIRHERENDDGTKLEAPMTREEILAKAKELLANGSCQRVIEDVASKNDLMLN